MIKYDLYKLLKEELKNGSADLVTRNSGQAIRERIERDIADEKDGEVIASISQISALLIIPALMRLWQSLYQGL